MQFNGQCSLEVTVVKGLKPEKWVKMLLVLRTLNLFLWHSALSDAS